MLLIGCGKRCDARTLDLGKVPLDGFRFQVECQSLGSAVQALGFDKARLMPCPNIRPNTVVNLYDLNGFNHKRAPESEALKTMVAMSVNPNEDSHLNARTCKSNAEKAYDRTESFKRTERYARNYQIQCGWNHTAPKQSIIQSTIGSPQFVIVLTENPDEGTLARSVKQGIQAYGSKRFASLLEPQLKVSFILPK
jgi:hypothetical protein